MKDAAIYLVFSAGALDFALFPLLSRSPLAAAARRSGQKQAWEWIRGQVREVGSNPERYREDLVETTGIIFAQLFHRISDCHLPLRVAPETAYELHQLRRVVSRCRLQVDGRTKDLPQMGRRALWEVVARNNDRARRRWFQGLARAANKGAEPIRTESGDTMNEPFDGELLPDVSCGGLTAHSSSPRWDANWNNYGGGHQGEFTGNPSTPERAGDTPEAPFPQRRNLS